MPKKYSVLLLLIFLVTGCGRSSLTYKNNTITLSVNDVSRFLKAHPHLTTYHNFQTLYINQHILLQDNGTYIVFEETRTDDLYQYEPGTDKSIKIIFETQNIIKVYGKHFLNFYQLTLKDGTLLNLITQQSDDQELALLYGMDTATFNRMMTHFDADAPPVNIDTVLPIEESTNAIRTKWDVRKIHFEPLIVPLKFLMGSSG